MKKELPLQWLNKEIMKWVFKYEIFGQISHENTSQERKWTNNGLFDDIILGANIFGLKDNDAY